MFIRNFLIKKSKLYIQLNKCSLQQTVTSTKFARALSTCSKQSGSNEMIQSVVDSETKIATLTMSRLPANAMSLEFMTAVKDTIHFLEQQKVSGIILTSSSDRIFCAGIDLNEAYKPELERLKLFWKALQDMWRALYATQIPTAALINGHALAGGCVLALSCDYRVILPNVTIGMNETQAGVAVPKFAMDSYVSVMTSRRIAEGDLISGKCYKSEDALRVGLVDVMVNTKEEGFQKCQEFLCQFEGPTRLAKAITKTTIRSDILRAFEEYRDKDLDIFINGILRPEVQEFLGTYLESLKRKKSSSKKT